MYATLFKVTRGMLGTQRDGGRGEGKVVRIY